MKKLKIGRELEEDIIDKENWKDLISALALCGYEVNANELGIVFELGEGDAIVEIDE